MNVTYLIVGTGLAGLCMAHFCQRNNKSFVMIDNGQRTSSKVAGGMFNPVVLKRFTAIWESQAQLELANKFYPETERLLGEFFYHKLPIYRKFASIEEQNNWFLACDNPLTTPFLNDRLRQENFLHLPAEFGFGEVYDTGYLDVHLFVTSYQKYLREQKLLLNTSFEYDSMEISGTEIKYRDISAQHIIFAEGFSMHQNPFFNYLPLDGTKGELLYVRIPDLKLQPIVKSGVFIIPMGNDIYKVGATYNWQDKTDNPTKEGYNELTKGLEKLINCPYEIVKHLAGVRPTVKDRRPLVGAHYKFKNIHILNGLGTRGVLLAPYLADKLIRNIENGVPLDKNIDVVRYYRKLQLIK
ncbi:MAG TPA: FAD-dependent oxidoreductase [Flavobacterium sp.]|nr:FAD-dependent oxidoreductase [Flavobacterium sp.]